jgi:hypothetical protein
MVSGNHGDLGMLMPNDEYVLISNGGTPYVAPAGPPPVPAFAGAAAVVATMQENYHQDVKSCEQYQDLRNPTKAMVLQAIPKAYTGVLAHAQLGYEPPKYVHFDFSDWCLPIFLYLKPFQSITTSTAMSHERQRG